MVNRHFFKVLNGDFTKGLRIPEAFIKQMPEELSGTALIQGFGGNCWPVKLNKTTRGTYLEDGWASFVKDHSLTLGEFLVFDYVGSMHFKITVFGTSTCNRENAFRFKVSHELTCPKGKKKCLSSQEDEGTFVADEVIVAEASTESTFLEGKKFKSARQDEGGIASTSKPKRLGDKVMEAASCFTSRFPYFLIGMKPYMVRRTPFVTIPKHFACEHFRKTLTTMMLQNVTGKTWKMTFRLGKPSRLTTLTGGWKVFVSDNHLKLGDYCVFELVKEDVMQVHIYRR